MEGQIILQILNGTIDPGWVISVLMGICIFLLVRVLNRIEKRLEVHDVKLEEHGKKFAALEAMKRAKEQLLPKKYGKDKGEN